MTLYLKFDFHEVCNKVLLNQLETHDIKHKMVAFGEVEILENQDSEKYKRFTDSLKNFHIEIVGNQKSILVEKIKDTIIDMVFNEETVVNVKTSAYLADKLEHSYGYLSNLFSEVTYTSIENFLIIQKIEYAKQLIIKGDLSLTEIAFKLDYSSVAHLSTQFKNTTGITPTAFQRIITKRRALKN
ncbi:helix-turn-helix domain-containing protein [Siansivirga zeaxanthinifaciens]|uniref:AraC family transcriptional regulator n=1 Tax=Siansivirga zeaxanthinifaciens CC-SAMT-1 TaxID=1454006 RepID=A0A0C5W077_9FLAO|nr:helix-turn-helix domain-containing protein [Siansivirga zeaxanthinifaciens]AJR04676.1 AraC family transcriptional regulator [Siansivirga zeaxanthinifaciens CC-SAMT-1]